MFLCAYKFPNSFLITYPNNCYKHIKRFYSTHYTYSYVYEQSTKLKLKQKKNHA